MRRLNGVERSRSKARGEPGELFTHNRRNPHGQQVGISVGHRDQSDAATAEVVDDVTVEAAKCTVDDRHVDLSGMSDGAKLDDIAATAHHHGVRHLR